MAEILTRTYTYTSDPGAASGTCRLALSSFKISGDTRPITQLLSISVEHRRYHDTSSTVSYTAKLEFANGAEAISSAAASKRGDRAWHTITNFFLTMPSAGDFTQSNVTVSISPNRKTNAVYWRTANTGARVIVTITYYSSEFKPALSGIKLYRASDIGAASDSGTHLTFQAKAIVENTGTNGSGVLKLYQGKTGDTVIYQKTGIIPDKTGVVITAAPIAGYSLPMGEAQHFRLAFEYTATTSSGIISTETVISSAILIDRVFTNFHLAGTANGGACFGGYSSSTEEEAKLESHYPGYFYGGIVNIQAGTVAPMGNTAGGSYRDSEKILFTKAFAQGTVPVVVVGFRSNSTEGGFGRCCVAVLEADHEGFTLRFFNGDVENRNPDFTYIAFGIPK